MTVPASVESPDSVPKPASRTGRFLQRFGWILPIGGFLGGWGSFILIHRGEELARIIAAAIVAGWLWLFVQPLVRPLLKKLGGIEFCNITTNFVTQSIQQEVLFFALPFLVLSTRIADPGQVVFTSFVVLVALLSTIDPWYIKIAKRPVLRLGFHSLCSFIAALIILPLVVKIPVERSFSIALGFVFLWMIIAAPLGLRDRQFSARAFALALLFPLGIWAMKSHIPAAGIQVRSAVLTSGISASEPIDELTRVSEAQLRKGLYVHASISAPSGLSQDIVFDWRHAGYSERIAATITGGRAEGFRTYATKRNFMQAPQGEWRVDILSPQGQLLDRVKFVVEAGAVSE